MDEGKRILLTGGHAATTGLAVIQEIKRELPDAKIFWIGAKNSISGTNLVPLEQKIYPSMGVKMYKIDAGKLQTKFTRYTIPFILKIPVGFFQALGLFLKIRPAITLSFGGYSSVPCVFWSWLFGVPVILHEQTVTAGRASMASAFFASKIALSREESQKYFPSGKSVVTGNPLIKEILAVKPPLALHQPPHLLIMGGSRGSEFINELVGPVIDKLKKSFIVIHLTGERDYPKYEKYSSSGYKVYSSVSPFVMADLYSATDIIISRSGANSIAEILAVKRPAILIPLPRTFMGEQYKNALFAEKQGLAKVYKEEEINADILLNALNETTRNWGKIVTFSKSTKSPDTEASIKVVSLLKEYL